MPKKIPPMTRSMLARVRDEVMRRLMEMWHKEGERVAHRIHNEAKNEPKP